MTVQDEPRFCTCGTRLSRTNPGKLCRACQQREIEESISAPLLPISFWETPEMSAALRSRQMGRVIYAYRTHPHHERPLSQELLAQWAGISQPQVSRAEFNPDIQPMNKLRLWANSLRIPRQLLWFAIDEPTAEQGELAPDAANEVSPTRRREFLALGGAVLSSGLLRGLEREPDLIHMTLDRGTASPDRVTRLEQLADSLGVDVVKVPPLSVLEPAQTALASVRTLLENRQPTGLQVLLVRTMAKLNTIIGEIMFNEGNFPLARRWYRTAGHAAADAGDQYLADIALAGQAYLPTYSDDPNGVLALLVPRLDANPTPSPAVAWLWGMRARAHAALGELAEYDRAIEMAQNCLASSSDELVIPGIFSFVPEKLAFYEANGAVLLDRPQRAARAADTALALYDNTETTEPALAKIELASALVQSGEPAEGCRIAIEAISDPSTYQSVTVRTRAQRFDSTLGDKQCVEVAEWREVRRALHGQRKPTE